MGRSVLLIEDEPNIVEALSFLLSRDGWTVRLHSKGEGAVEAVKAAQPDVVVLDVMLPGRSGFEILKELRQGAVDPNLPILMLTARGQKTDREMAESYGVSHFMTKPFSNAEILMTVQNLAEGKTPIDGIP